jgi:resuscitation-promoting factor RpfB
MSTLFAVLMFASLVLLVWGLISPSSLSKHASKPFTRKEAGISFGLIALIFMVLTGVTAPKQANQTPTGTNNVKSRLSEPEPTAAKRKPIITKETLTESAEIPFDSTNVNDPTRTAGTSAITIPGVIGIKTLTYEITKTDGVATDKKLIKEEIAKTPVAQVTSVGTKVAKATPKPTASSSCDPNYSGACVPITSDVDCAGGSGNGPAYVSGPVKVIGVDIYDLDRDGNGYGCE